MHLGVRISSTNPNALNPGLLPDVCGHIWVSLHGLPYLGVRVSLSPQFCGGSLSSPILHPVNQEGFLSHRVCGGVPHRSSHRVRRLYALSWLYPRVCGGVYRVRYSAHVRATDVYPRVCGGVSIPQSEQIAVLVIVLGQGFHSTWAADAGISSWSASVYLIANRSLMPYLSPLYVEMAGREQSAKLEESQLNIGSS